METIIYKGFTIQTNNGSAFIYDEKGLQGCTYTDYPEKGENNSYIKAMQRIDLFLMGAAKTLKGI